jgi:hypothetical protein
VKKLLDNGIPLTLPSPARGEGKTTTGNIILQCFHVFVVVKSAEFRYGKDNDKGVSAVVVAFFAFFAFVAAVKAEFRYGNGK